MRLRLNTNFSTSRRRSTVARIFNILKPSALLSTDAELGELGIVAGGNLLATYTLMLLCLLAFIGVTLVIGVPLLLSGKPQLPKGVFGSGLLYFACIGTGFMMVRIPLIQRFSVYLGHPVYAVSVLLFSMIIAAGLGSSLSDRIAVERDRRWTFVLPLTIVAMIIALYLLSGPIIQATIDQGLLVRCLIVILLVAAAALPMGMCFPLGTSPVPPILGRLLTMAVGCEWRHGRTGKRASRGDLDVEWDQLWPARGDRLMRW